MNIKDIFKEIEKILLMNLEKTFTKICTLTYLGLNWGKIYKENTKKWETYTL